MYKRQVLFRPTTRVCHAYANVTLKDSWEVKKAEGFVKDPKWVIFPRLSYQSHLKIEKRNVVLADDFSSYHLNTITGGGRKGIATGGISYAYTQEAFSLLGTGCKSVSYTHLISNNTECNKYNNRCGIYNYVNKICPIIILPE